MNLPLGIQFGAVRCGEEKLLGDGAVVRGGDGLAGGVSRILGRTYSLLISLT